MRQKKYVLKKKMNDVKIICNDVVNENIDDADVILFWFTDENILKK